MSAPPPTSASSPPARGRLRRLGWLALAPTAFAALLLTAWLTSGLPDVLWLKFHGEAAPAEVDARGVVVAPSVELFAYLTGDGVYTEPNDEALVPGYWATAGLRGVDKHKMRHAVLRDLDGPSFWHRVQLSVGLTPSSDPAADYRPTGRVIDEGAILWAEFRAE